MDFSLVVVGRTKHYGGPFKITTEADLYEDKFEVMTLSTQSGFRYLSYLPTLWIDKLRGTNGVFFSKTDSVFASRWTRSGLTRRWMASHWAGCRWNSRLCPPH